MLGIMIDSLRKNLATAFLLGGLIFIAALLGILTRSVDCLASLWPTNALLLGLLVRHPSARKKLNWLAAFVGYIAADFATGGELNKTLILTSCNFAGVTTGYYLLLRLSKNHLLLLRPSSVFYLVLISGAAASASGLIGAVIDPVLFGGTLLADWAVWFVGELVSYVIILPVVLTAPNMHKALIERRRDVLRRTWATRVSHYGPGVTFMLSCAAGVLMGGPGAIMFPVPTLLWCALSYSLFTTTVVTLCFSAWTLVAISKGILGLSIVEPISIFDLQSIRLGILLLALTPLTLAIINRTRNELLCTLQYVASHDQLSGLLNRGAFNELSNSLLERLERQENSVGVLMLDIDHFKRVNDTWGHATGDQVLVIFAKIVRDCVRAGDVLGRVGGEEFALVMPASSAEDVQAVAHRIRTRFADERIPVGAGAADIMRASVSIGGVFAVKARNLERLLQQADIALYRAKHLGRNRVEIKVFGDLPNNSQL